MAESILEQAFNPGDATCPYLAGAHRTRDFSTHPEGQKKRRLSAGDRSQ
jgi:hypothetical protein